MMTAWGDMALEGWLWMGVWIIALLVMVWLLVGGTRERPSEQDALDILRARFARGEINQQEFEAARDLLNGPRTHASQTGAPK